MRKLLLALVLTGCSFPTDGVALQGDPPDAEVVPPDACVPSAEVCDGADNDCDGTIDDGVSSGAACDGDDADLCLDDTMICDSSGAEVCSSGDDNAELCNAADDDCDGNMDEGFALNVDCDGADGDACNEGKTICSGDGLSTACNDVTDTIAEICDGNDEDCDGTPDDGFDLTTDENNCGQCENACTNPRGSTTCQPPGTCTPVCNNGAANCNGDVDDGCELVDTNPACASETSYAKDSSNNDADVNGDTSGETITLTGTTERFMRIKMRESSFAGSSDPITGRLTLTSGAGTDWDLYVYCLGDGTTPCGTPPMSDPTDVVEVGRDDAAGVDRSFDIIAEVRYDPSTPSTTCAQWTLTVVGDPTPTPTNRCAN